MLGWYRQAAWACFFLATCPWFSQSAARCAERESEAADELEEAASIFLPAPRALRQHLTRARRALEEQRYPDAASELGSLLTSAELNQGGRDGKEPQDFFLAAPQGGGTQTSLKTEAQRLLGQMPARARELYELQYGAEARALLAEATRTGDVEKLSEVARRFFHTRAGYEATVLLGRVQFDRGRPLAAALCWKRVLDSPAAAAAFEPELSVQLAAGYFQAGRTEAAERVLRGLRERLPQTGLRVGSQPVGKLPAAGEELAWLKNRFAPAESPAGDPTSARWTVYRGDPMRNAPSAGGIPLRTPRWRAATADDPADDRILDDLMQGFVDEDLPAIPALQPLAVDNVVLLRSPDRLLAIDFETGKRIWEYPWWDRAYPRTNVAGREATRTAELEGRRMQLTQRLWYDAPYGQLSSDGEAVFLLDELRFAPANSSFFHFVPGGLAGQRNNPNAPAPFNQLVALDLRRQGALRWMVGKETGLDDPRLAGAFFLGPPLPLFGQLYVLAELNAEIRLVVLDPRTGQQEWSQQLAHVDGQSVLENPMRRLVGASPSFADGVLVCPTGAGAVVAVDIGTRSLLWGYQYAPRGSANPQMGMLQPHPGQVLRTGNRWLDGTITLADGCVLLTPPESDKLCCLDLLTGQPKWPPRDRMADDGDWLYLGCVDSGNVVLVGRDRVMALRLADGQPAWPAPVLLSEDQREMPSGRGYHSQHHYYLPTTGAHLLKIDLQQGRLVERTKTGSVLGNLVCHRDQVLAQGVESLAAYYQIDPLRQQVAQRLSASADDAWALARQGELLVNDRNVPAALAALRRAYELQPQDDEVRSLLVSTFLSALEGDFAGHRQLAAQVEPLINTPEQQLEYLRLLAAGWLASGQQRDALGALTRLVDLVLREGERMPSWWETTLPVGPSWSVRLDRWLRARFDELAASGDEAVRAAIDELVRARLRAAEAASRDDLRRFLAIFGDHPQAQPARLRLVEEQLKSNEWLAAETELTALQASSDETVSRAATALLAKTLTLAGHNESAVAVYRQLAERWNSTVCYDGKTGQQLLDEAQANGSLKDEFAVDRAWPAGRVQVSESNQGLGRQSYRRLSPVPLQLVAGMPGRVSAMFFDGGISAALARDADGKTLFPVKFNGGLLFYSQQNGMSRAVALGNLLLVAVADQIVAVDAFRAAADDEEAVLWRASLTQAVPDFSPQPPQCIARSSNNPFESEVLPVFFLADAANRPLGKAGPVVRGGVVYQKVRTLVCADPLTGRVNWTRTDFGQGADVFGDEQYILVVPPEGGEATLLAPLDGREIGQRTVPSSDRTWAIHGRRMLTWESAGTETRLELFDAVQSAPLWSMTFAAGSRGCLIDNEEVAVLQPDGRLVIRSLSDDRLRVEQQVPAEPKLDAVHVVASPGEYLVFASRGGGEDGVINGGLPVKQIQGRLHAFDRSTGKPLWPTPALIDGYSLPLTQPSVSPALWFVRQSSERSREMRTGPGGKASVLGIDRRTGRLLVHKTELASQVNFHEITADPAAHTVTFSIPGYSATLTFTAEPVPPEPPAQVGGDSTAADSAARRVRDLARSLMDVLSEGQPAPSPFEGDAPQTPPAPAEKPAANAPRNDPR